MILCKMPNLNSAFAVKIKALRGRNKEKAKSRGNSFLSSGFIKFSIPLTLLVLASFLYLNILTGNRMKSLWDTDMSQEA